MSAFVEHFPQVVRVGSKKTAFANFSEIAKMLHRQPKVSNLAAFSYSLSISQFFTCWFQHLLAFLFAELGTSGAIDGSNQLIMKGKSGIFLFRLYWVFGQRSWALIKTMMDEALNTSERRGKEWQADLFKRKRRKITENWPLIFYLPDIPMLTREIPAEAHRECVETVHQGVCNLSYLQVSFFKQNSCNTFSKFHLKQSLPDRRTRSWTRRRACSSCSAWPATPPAACRPSRPVSRWSFVTYILCIKLLYHHC